MQKGSMCAWSVGRRRNAAKAWLGLQLTGTRTIIITPLDMPYIPVVARRTTA
jgi:hypothetical protein